MMTECEKFVSFANPEFEDDNAHSFEETIPKVKYFFKSQSKIKAKYFIFKLVGTTPRGL